MPELPDIRAYLVALEPRVVSKRLRCVRVKSPFLVRSIAPPIQSLEETCITGIRRLGKRTVFAFERDRFLVVHLMVAGRFRWRKAGAGLPGKMGLAAFDFDDGTLLLTEAGSKRRASIHVVGGEVALAEHDPGGAEIAELDAARFGALLREENHTLKRSLTDPRIFSGIGNAYSDEIPLRARRSPLLLTNRITDEEIAASNETNYCPTCQTGGKLLADRALSQLLKKDWPRTVEALEARRRGDTGGDR